MKKFILSMLFVMLASVSSWGQFTVPTHTSWLPLPAGWTYLQDFIYDATCTTSSASCTYPTILPTTAGSVWVAWMLDATNNITLSSVTGGGGTWTHCPSCAVYNTTMTEGLDAYYNVTGTAGTTPINVTTSATPSVGWQVGFIELKPPAGTTASYDTSGSINDTTNCTSCAMPSLT